MTNKLPGYLDLPDLTYEAAAFAAKWWADTIRNQVRWDNGEPFQGAMMSVFASKFREDITPEIVDMFEKTLLGEMLEPKVIGERETGEYAPKKGVIDYGRAHQRIDYHPSGVLCDALKLLAEMPPGTAEDVVKAWQRAVRSLENLFPCKTDVDISPVAVVTALGYGAPRKVEWQAYDRVSPEDYRVIDRLYSGRHEYTWKNGGESGALAYVTLDKEAVEPTVMFCKLRGYAKANLYNRDLEEPLSLCSRIAYAFSNAVEPGYLALIVER